MKQERFKVNETIERIEDKTIAECLKLSNNFKIQSNESVL